MKIAAFILTCVLVFVMLQPLIASNNSKNKQCSAKKCCKKKDTNKKEGKETGNCNPLMGCPYCNALTIPIFSFAFTSTLLPENIFFISNDNCVSNYLSECWHPPNMA